MPKRWLTLSVALMLVGCAPEQPAFNGVPGPETPALLDRLHGHLLITEPVGGIAHVQLRGARYGFLREPKESADDGQWPVHTLAGPDRHGRVAFVEYDMGGKRHWLIATQLGTAEKRILFERAGDPLCDDAIGEYLALSRDSGRIAAVIPPKKAQMPGALLSEGPIDVIDITSGSCRRFDVRAIDDTLAWMPDGRGLVFVALVPPEQAPPLPAPADDFDSFYSDWPDIPVVCLLDTDSGAVRPLHRGRAPVVSTDGKQMLVMGESNQVTPNPRGYRWEPRNRLLSLDGSSSTPVKLHGNGQPLTLFDDGIYLCLAAPTEGHEMKYTVNNSPLVGPKLMLSIKVARLGGDEFATVVPQVDPRRRIAYGAGGE